MCQITKTFRKYSPYNIKQFISLITFGELDKILLLRDEVYTEL